MLDIVAKIFSIMLGRKVLFSFEDAIWKQTEKSKKFKTFINLVVKILSAIVIIFVLLILVISVWFFYKYFSGDL